jgi:hypothetical protein
MRVSWDDSRKVRLSPAALELLRRMCSDGISIRYEFRTGHYTRFVNGSEVVVQERTVSVLVRSGFITRLKDETPSYAAYTANERARQFFKRTEEANQMNDQEKYLTPTQIARGVQLTPEQIQQADSYYRNNPKRPLVSKQPQTQPKPQPTPTEGEAAIAEIKRIKAGKSGPQHVTILTVTQAESEARITQILKVANQSTKGESMSNKTKEPDIQTVANLATDYIADEKARGRKVSLSAAVAHVRKTKFNLDTDFNANDPDMTRHSCQQD